MNFAPDDAENVLTFLSRAHGTLKWVHVFPPNDLIQNEFIRT